MNVGDAVCRRGFFTKALYLRMQPASEIERRLGYRCGRLAAGWWLLFMLEIPSPLDFEFAAYSHWSGGVAQGHLPYPPDPRTAEQRLRDSGANMLQLKTNLIRTVFTLAGADRLAKVVPVNAEFGEDDYPVGGGVPQWKLVRPKRFQAAAFIGPGGHYEGMYL